MRILQWYVLREHVAPFFFAFFTITFLLIIDYVPKIIDRVIDKDLDLLVVLELLALNLAWMLALSIPMSVLVATLMAFGRLSSDFEITAIKASGVNLIHILLPLLLAGSVITYLMVQFNDKILPDLNKQARELTGSISAMRPTLVFRSGAFISDIPGYLILVDKIDHTTSHVEGVRIAETEDPSKPRIIVADSGYLQSTNGGKNMQFTLYDGEVHEMDLKEPENYRKLDFRHQVINVSGVGSELTRTSSEYQTDREMGIGQMQARVNQAIRNAEPVRERIAGYFQNKFNYLFSDSFAFNLSDSISDSAALQLVRNDARVMIRHLERNLQQIDTQKKITDKFTIEIYKKYSIPAASLAFILIGAPLGILTRRGGIGIAITVSILLFIVYWAFLIGGEDVADRGLIHPFWAMWGANILLALIGVYLIYIVLTEKPLFAWFRRIN
ncbi:MAG: LptF/LptG family permease [Candidatus Zixiibacteriota bacterium]|nr:MAG: LptF/LptG family permease [candidate division Zixibacteria bacterium]